MKQPLHFGPFPRPFAAGAPPQSFLAALALAASFAPCAPAQESARDLRRPALREVAVSLPATKAPPRQEIKLPPLPEGVQELRFSDFFQMPVGPRGLDLTDRLKSLDGKRVRILGCMVYEDLTPCNSCPRVTRDGHPLPAWIGATVPGRMLLAPFPVMLNHSHYGLADDLPPQTVFVTVPDKYGALVPYTPGPLLLTGTLSVGNKQEADGRISVVRLVLDVTEHAAAATSLSNTNPTQQASQP